MSGDLECVYEYNFLRDNEIGFKNYVSRKLKQIFVKRNIFFDKSANLLTFSTKRQTSLTSYVFEKYEIIRNVSLKMVKQNIAEISKLNNSKS